MKRVGALAALALAVPSFAWADSNKVPASTAAQVASNRTYEAALSLAKVLHKEDDAKALINRLFDQQVAEIALKDPDSLALEKQYPGITQTMVDAMRPVALKSMVSSMPQQWDETAKLLASELTLDEIIETKTYYLTTSGQRLMQSMLVRYDYETVINDTIKNDGVVKSDSLKTGLTKNLSTVVGDMTTAEQEVLLEFSKTSAFQKLQRLNPRMLELHAKFANGMSTEDEAEMGKMAKIAVESYIATHTKSGSR